MPTRKPTIVHKDEDSMTFLAEQMQNPTLHLLAVSHAAAVLGCEEVEEYGDSDDRGRAVIVMRRVTGRPAMRLVPSEPTSGPGPTDVSAETSDDRPGEHR